MGIDFQTQKGNGIYSDYKQNVLLKDDALIGCETGLNKKSESQDNNIHISSNNNGKDDFIFKDINNKHTNELKFEINNTQKEQGFIGSTWDSFKNFTGLGYGSNKAQKAVSDFQKGCISQEEMDKAVSEYREGQKQCVDIAADVISGFASFGAFSIATGIGIAAAPFTGGASLGLIAAGFSMSGVIGVGVKKT